jgi:hypothetical protein
VSRSIARLQRLGLLSCTRLAWRITGLSRLRDMVAVAEQA